MLHNLRPRLKRLTSYDEALMQVNDILRKEAEAGGKGGMLGAIDEEGRRLMAYANDTLFVLKCPFP